MSSLKSDMSASEAILALFEEQKDCDIKFSIDSKTIGAHKLFLKARNEVLAEWTQDWTSKDEPLVVDDLSFDTFKAVLRYIYTDDVEITDENVFQFLFAAKNFKMGHLEAKCAKHIASFLSKENVLSYIENAIEFKAAALQQECCKVFSKETTEIVGNPEFHCLSQPALSALLDADEINMLEIDLFLGVKKWMVEQCKNQGLPTNGQNMRRVIGESLYKLRFPTMTNLDFSNEVTTIDGLLSDSEMLQTYRKISVSDNENIQCPFSAKCRSANGVSQENISSRQNLLNSNIIYNSTYGSYHIANTFYYWHNDSYKYNFNRKCMQLILQCCSDLMNSTTAGSDVSGQLDPTIKGECYAKYTEWSEVHSSNPQNLQNIMPKFNALRETLVKLP